jgi:hypothetical protein
MSTLVLTGQSQPATPSSGKVRFWSGVDGNLRSVDSTGNVIVYSPGITAEEVEDIVGSFVTGSSSIQVVYNDPLNTLTLSALPAGIDHDSLANYVANKHINHSTVSISAGTGLSGGGDITASRTIGLANTTVASGSYGSASQVPVYTVNAQGQLTAASNTSIAIPASAITDFAVNTANANGQFIYWNSTTSKWTNTTDGWCFDVNILPANGQIMQWSLIGSRWTAVATPASNGQFLQWDSTLSQWKAVVATTTMISEGTNLYYTDTRARAAISVTDSASVDFTYNSGNITAVVLPAGVNHDALNNYVANKHVDHSGVSISTGAGLTGGGDLTSTRTLALTNTGVTAASYGTATQVPTISIDAYGRISAAANTGIQIAESQVTNLTTDLANKVPTTRTVSAGSGLSGGGDLSADRTISMPNVGTAGTYGSASQVPVITTDAQGRVSSVTNTGISIPFSSITSLPATLAEHGITDVVIPDNASTAEGTLRFNNGELQVRQGGVWLVVTQNPTVLTSTTSVTSTSATYAVISGMTVTPTAGTYRVDFTASAGLSNNNSTANFAIYLDATQEAETLRTLQNGAATAIQSSVAMSTVITVNGAQAISARFNRSAGGATVTCYARTLIITPISR